VAFARIAELFDPPAVLRPGIHASAVVDGSAVVDAGAEVGPLVVIGANSRIAGGARIGPGCVVGEDCVVGEGCELTARVTLVKRVRLGKRVLIHPGAVLGADGFGLAMERPEDGEPHWIKVPQQGGVLIGDDCEIGANTSIDRGAIEDTVLEHDVRLDNQIQIGHNARIGAHTAMAGCAAVAGSAEIGRYCLIGGGAGVLGHLRICDHVSINAMALVTSSIEQPGEYSSGTPLMDTRSWRKSAARFKQLDSLARRLRAGSQEE
jgi:UDP-3-O-[3-hydroxymyristoyl] glucosamine N-acyltransferase